MRYEAKALYFFKAKACVLYMELGTIIEPRASSTYKGENVIGSDLGLISKGLQIFESNDVSDYQKEILCKLGLIK
jgi:hypothetical protein